MHQQIHQLKLSVSNAYLLIGTRPVLVDTGSPKDFELLRSKLRNHGIEFKDLSLIAHTHIHSDHAGCTSAIVAESGCPVGFNKKDLPISVKGSNGKLNGVGLRGKIMSRFFSHTKFQAIDADIWMNNGEHLGKFGINAEVIATPGHTPGSISFVLPSGEAIVGDVIMGGVMGGNFQPSKPNFHYFADDITQCMNSLDEILERASGTVYVGHGGPLTYDSVAAWRNRNS